MALILIDGDILTYQIGFACQKVYYSFNEHYYKSKKEAIAAFNELGMPNKKIRIVTVSGTEDQASLLLRQKIQSIFRDCGTTNYKMFITASGKSNFRFLTAKFQPYKGNRRPEDKPRLYEAIRNLLVTEWKAEVVTGMEADDMLGIQALSKTLRKEHGNPIIASIDKDLLMIPCLHYNMNSRDISSVSRDEADRTFFLQCLSGDTVDNIPSLVELAAKYAAEGVSHYLRYNKYKTLASNFSKRHTVPALRQYVFNQFRHAGIPDEVRDEVCTLLWILRNSGETWYNWDQRLFGTYTYIEQEDDLCRKGMIGKLGLSQCLTTGVLSRTSESTDSTKQEDGDLTSLSQIKKSQ
jgi:hypothetical protein